MVYATKKILLLGSYGRGNIGDDIYLSIILDKLKNEHVYFNCWNNKLLPKDIKIYKYQNYFASALFTDIGLKLRVFLKSDIIMYGGGELWMRLKLNRFKNMTLYKMLIINLVSKIFRKKIYYISVGAEPLKGWSLILARISARMADYVIFRDKDSPVKLGLKSSKIKVSPDLVLIYKYRRKPHKARNVGINLLYDVGDANERDRYTASMAKIISVLNENIVYIPGLIDDTYVYDDRFVAETIMAKTNIKSSIANYNSIREIFEIIIDKRYIITTRLHIAIIAMLVGTPVISISYKPKVVKFYKELGFRRLTISTSATQVQFMKSYSYMNLSSTKIKLNSVFAKKCEEAHTVYDSFFDTITKKGG